MPLAAADLVEQYERSRSSALQNVAQHGDVGGEGGEARGDGLTVSDVRKHAREHREGRLRADRRDDAALRHEAQQPHSLDQYRLATGVRAGDQDGELVGREDEIERDDCLTP